MAKDQQKLMQTGFRVGNKYIYIYIYFNIFSVHSDTPECSVLQMLHLL